MPLAPKLPSGVRRLFRLPWSRAGMRRDLDDEVRFHLDMRAAELRAQGMAPDEADAEALRRFGDVDDLRQDSARTGEHRARWAQALEWLGGWALDVRFAGRQLLASPVFTIAATLTLAIAIGATASVFGVVDGVLLKAFPYRDPDRVLSIWES